MPRRWSWRSGLVASVAVSLSAGQTAAAPDGAGSPWAQLAETDLRAAHDQLQANHPGAVDPDNHAFAGRLESGLADALKLAHAAVSFAEYKRALQRYMNQFQDDHVHIQFDVDQRRYDWPGFVVAADDVELRSISVRESEIDEVPVGARLLGCDGVDLEALLMRNVFRYRTIVEIPHARLADVPYLFVEEGDPFGLRPRNCEFDLGGTRRNVALEWQSGSREALRSRVDRALGRVEGDLSLRRVGRGHWLSIPSFDWWGGDAPRMTALLEQLRRDAPRIRAGDWLVIDVRGNAGGNSEWGNRVISTLWSPEWLAYADSRLDDSVDWRASAGNIEELRHIIAATEQAFGDAEAAAYWRAALRGMEQAEARGDPYFHVRDATAPAAQPVANPMHAGVYFLTDHRCASACLNFADALFLLPGVVHVGLPTSADTPYIDVRNVGLPSGAARLFIAMKVYRHYARAANQWYEPAERWPGGAMTDDALVAWIAEIHARRSADD